MKTRLLTLWCVAGLGLLSHGGAARAQRLERPEFTGTHIVKAWFGDARNVELLAGLVNDPDPYVREQAVRDLAQTHNRAAWPLVQAALKDKHPVVRAAAAAGALECSPDDAATLLAATLKDTDPFVVRRALSVVRHLNATGLRQEVLASASGESTADALATLTALRLAAPPEKLRAFLGDASLRVRVEAARNAEFLEDGRDVLDALKEAAAGSVVPLSAAAIPALGKLDPAGAAGRIQQALSHQSPLVRKAAVQACQAAGNGAPIRRMLDDPSQMVRYAAVQAAGRLKREDCVDRLFELLFDAAVDDEKTQLVQPYRFDLAARDALSQIGTQKVIDRCAKTIESAVATGLGEVSISQAAAKGDGDRLRMTLRAALSEDRVADRNLRACSWILGEHKSKAGYDAHFTLAKAVQLDTHVFPVVVEALGKIGDPRAKDWVSQRLAFCRRQGIRMLIESTKMQPAYVEYSEPATVELLIAAARLGIDDAADRMADIAEVQGAGLRLGGREAAVAIRELSRLPQEARAKRIDKAISTLLGPDGYPLLAVFEAALAAGNEQVRGPECPPGPGERAEGPPRGADDDAGGRLGAAGDHRRRAVDSGPGPEPERPLDPPRRYEAVTGAATR